jgi:hypothetical protein
MKRGRTFSIFMIRNYGLSQEAENYFVALISASRKERSRRGYKARSPRRATRTSLEEKINKINYLDSFKQEKIPSNGLSLVSKVKSAPRPLKTRKKVSYFNKYGITVGGVRILDIGASDLRYDKEKNYWSVPIQVLAIKATETRKEEPR